MKTSKGLIAFVLCATATGAWAQEDNDSLRLEHMQEIVVSGVRVTSNAPFAVANIQKAELQQFATTGRELPILLARTPGILAWGENGLGTGTTYMRIRGAGDSRINVTLDGVSLNSPEDQCVFWANMNSYASLLGSIQVQRGVGTSTNGDGAFGGTIALSTAAASYRPIDEVTFSIGSYNTMNFGASASTGLLWDKLIVDAAWHQTMTDGFLHGSDGRSGSYYGGLTFMPNHRFTLRYKNIGNYEHTGQAWNGVTAGDNYMSIMDSTFATPTGIKTYRDLYDHGLGKYNTLYETLKYADDGSFERDADGNYITQRYPYKDGFWSHTTDNFSQNHNLLSAVWDINDRWTATATLHYTYGYGYYEELRPKNGLKKFGLENFTTSNGSIVEEADFIRKKGLGQHTYGAVVNTNYKVSRWAVTLGGGFQQFRGNHFGYLTYTDNDELAAKILSNGRYQYYDSDAKKSDGNVYAKANYFIVNTEERTASLFADLQYRYVHYVTDGINDKFYEEDSRYYNQQLDIDKRYHFFNPKIGFNGRFKGHRVYWSAAVANREPERNNFTDNGSYPAPEAERVLDFELGYAYEGRTWHAGLNFYSMSYKNQFVQTGEVSDIGEKLTTNIKRSDRMGVELTAGWDVTKWLSLEGNAALSQNRIHDFDEVVEDWDNGTQIIHYDQSTLAFSPAVILNGFIDFHWKGLSATWHTNYVSRQYLDNTENRDRSLPAFSVSNLRLQYTLPCHRFLALREVVFGANFDNLFNRRYASAGWVYSAICESAGHTNNNRYYQIGFIPSAGFTALGSVTLRF